MNILGVFLLVMMGFETASCRLLGAYEACKKQNYDEAERILLEDMTANPFDVKTNALLAEVYYKKKLFKQAAETFNRAKGYSKDNEEVKKLTFNVANAFYEDAIVSLGEGWETRNVSKEILIGALESAQTSLKQYHEFLQSTPADHKASSNKQVVEELIKKIEEKLKEPPQEQQQEQNKNNQDKNQSNEKKQNDGKNDKQNAAGKNDKKQKKDKDADNTSQQQSSEKGGKEGSQKQKNGDAGQTDRRDQPDQIDRADQPNQPGKQESSSPESEMKKNEQSMGEKSSDGEQIGQEQKEQQNGKQGSQEQAEQKGPDASKQEGEQESTPKELAEKQNGAQAKKHDEPAATEERKEVNDAQMRAFRTILAQLDKQEEGLQRTLIKKQTRSTSAQSKTVNNW